MAAAVEKIMIEGVLGFCGIETMLYKNLYEVPTVTEDERNKMLLEIEYLISNAI